MLTLNVVFMYILLRTNRTEIDRLDIGQGYTDGRVKCRKPVEEPGTAPRVRVGNFVALLIERKSSSF